MSTQAFSSPFARPFNPFLPTSEDTLVEIEEVVDAHNVSYALVQSGPSVSAEEVESHLDAVEVKVTWGTQTLSLTHLDGQKKKSFTIGEEGDFAVPHVDTLSVVDYRGNVAYVVIPENASGTVSAKAELPRSVHGGEHIALAEGMTVRIELGSVTIEVSSVRAGKKTPVGFLASLASGAAAFIGLSFVGHAAIVASLAMFMPKMNADDAEQISQDQFLAMRAMMDTSAEREADQLKNNDTSSADPTGGGSTGGAPHQGESGVAGTTKQVSTKGHMAFKGSDDHVQLSRAETLKLAQTEGMVGLLLADAQPKGHTSPWAIDNNQLGQDPDNKLGSMFGQNADDAMGYGLGLTGTGMGGGGPGVGIGIDGVGSTVGGGGGGPGKWGYGKGDKDGLGNGHGPGTGGHVAKAPQIRPNGEVKTNGRIPAEVIQRIVRQNMGVFRMCYENGLRQNPSLNGRVVTKFVIDRNGAVSQAADAGSDLASQEVVGCVVRGFTNLSFPAPEGGIVTVSYPLMLTPGE